MTNIEDQENDMNQQRIDELQIQYFQAKLATIDVKRLQEARESLERRRSSAESEQRDGRDPVSSNQHLKEEPRAPLE